MILVGNQRGGARDLAMHLLKDDNDHVDVHELRGFVSDNLPEALSEVQAISKGTKCRQYLFSLSMSPPEVEAVGLDVFETAIEQIETRLGLDDQPRAIVFHEKEGRRHAHVVWSRIKADKMKAVQLSFSKQKLNTFARELFLTHDWKLPEGFIDPSLSNPLNFTHAEWQQAKRSDTDPREIKQVFQAAWEASDSKGAFIAALEERGYRLARGRKSFVAVDMYGEVYSVARQAKVKVRALKARLGDPSALPSVDIVQIQYAADMLRKMEGYKADINHAASGKAKDIQRRRTALIDRQRQERKTLSDTHAARQTQETKERQARFRQGLKGLWDRLRGEHGRISRLNTQEAGAAQRRDRREQDGLSVRHLSERRVLKQHVRDLREHFSQERQILSQDLERFQPIQTDTAVPKMEP